MTIKFIDGDLNLQSVTKIVNSETSPPTRLFKVGCKFA